MMVSVCLLLLAVPGFLSTPFVVAKVGPGTVRGRRWWPWGPRQDQNKLREMRQSRVSVGSQQNLLLCDAGALKGCVSGGHSDSNCGILTQGLICTTSRLNICFLAVIEGLI